MGIVDMSEGEADYLKYRFKQYLGSVSREIQNRRLDHMGMTIDKTIEFYNGLECYTPQAKDARDVAITTMRKYQMMQADYETRLKADMVAMLTELKTEIEELDSRAGYSGDGMPTFSTDYIRKKKVNELVQQKINDLKGEIHD